MTQLERLLKERAHLAYLDNLIVPLLIERLKRAKKIGSLKWKQGLPLQDLRQEKAVLDWIRAEHSELPDEVILALSTIYRAIFKAMRTLQEGQGHA